MATLFTRLSRKCTYLIFIVFPSGVHRLDSIIMWSQKFQRFRNWRHWTSWSSNKTSKWLQRRSMEVSLLFLVSHKLKVVRTKTQSCRESGRLVWVTNFNFTCNLSTNIVKSSWSRRSSSLCSHTKNSSYRPKKNSIIPEGISYEISFLYDRSVACSIISITGRFLLIVSLRHFRRFYWQQACAQGKLHDKTTRLEKSLCGKLMCTCLRLLDPVTSLDSTARSSRRRGRW